MFHRMFMGVVLLVGVLLGLGCQGECGRVAVPAGGMVSPTVARADDALVGVNYFAGWWPDKPNKWLDAEDGHEWLEDYPGRTPLLGKYNSQETMDREIVAAAEHGVDFFMILWYAFTPELPDGFYQHRKLNDGLTQFINSPEAHRMQFCIEWCNHPPFHVKTLEHWQECIDTWMPAFRHPSYLRVDGRLVFKVHSSGQMHADLGGSVPEVRQWLDILRQRVRDAGLGDMVICGGAPGPMVDPAHWVQNVFEFTGDYMDVPKWFPTHLAPPYPYGWLANFLLRMRSGHQFDPVPYLPVVASGWDPRPWHYPEDVRPAFTFPSRDEWVTELRRIGWEVTTLPNRGIPRRDGSVQPAFMIYAWNEFGEGSFVAPTQGDGWLKLQGIDEVFGGR